MNPYEELLNDESGKTLSLSKLKQALKTTDSYEDAYWIGKILLDQEDENLEWEAFEAFDRAFYLGLNIRSNRAFFMEAVRLSAKIAFSYQEYVEARNLLMVLVENSEDHPAWVHLYFALCQIHTDTLPMIAEDPTMFFRRLGQVDINNHENLVHVQTLYLEFLNILTDAYINGLKNISSSEIIVKACEYDLNNYPELFRFRDIVCPDYKIPGEDQDSDEELRKTKEELKKIEAELEKEITKNDTLNQLLSDLDSSNEENNLQLRQEIAELQQKIAEKENSIDKLNIEIADLRHQLSVKNVRGHSLLRGGKKILVIGATEVKPQDFQEIAKNDFLFDGKDFEFCLDYNKIPGFVGTIRKNSTAYAGIIAGPMPHKAENKGEHSSWIHKIQNEPGYPPLFKAMASQTLKLSQSSFRDALSQLVTHLQTIELAA